MDVFQITAPSSGVLTVRLALEQEGGRSASPLDGVLAELDEEGMLFVGDKGSLQASPDQCKEIASKPDVLLTELSQIAEVIG